MIEQVAEAMLPVASWLLFASLKSIVVIPLVLLIRHFCARWLTPQGRYGLWLAVLACLAIPFGAQVNIHHESNVATAPAHVQAISQPDGANHQQPVITMADAADEPTASLSPQTIAILMWMLGVSALTLTVLYNAARYARMRSAASEFDAATDELFQNCKRELVIRGRVRFLETSSISSPVLVGYWRPTLLLPRDLSARISRGELRLVLLHELAHVRRHDILANWLISLVQVAHWFNPLAWYALRVARHDMEQACDADVLRHLTTSERFEYGDTLIKLSDFTPRRALLVQNASVVESRSQLKARINMIAHFKPRGAASSILGAALITLTSIAAITQAADAPRQPVKAPSRTLPVAATVQNPAMPLKEIQPQTNAGTSTTAQSTKPLANPTKQKTDPAAPQAVVFKIKYAWAKDLATFIKSAPGIGLLSDQGTITVNDATNMLVVFDTPDNVAAIRDLVARLDVPVPQVLLEAHFALLDEDFIQELKAGATADVRVVPAFSLGAETAVTATLEAGVRAHRAEVISSPHLIMANRKKTSIEQGTNLPMPSDAAADAPQRKMKLMLGLTPAMRPDTRIGLDINANVTVTSTAIRVMTSPGTFVPTIDNRELTSFIVLDPGVTAMLDFDGAVGSREETAEHRRRLVAFITLKPLTGAVPSR